MTNKYQEALHQIKYCFEQGTNENLKESLNDLQELVDKEVPAKPIVFKGIFSEYEKCPNCKESDTIDTALYRLDRCSNCGQIIDWSEDD